MRSKQIGRTDWEELLRAARILRQKLHKGNDREKVQSIFLLLDLCMCRIPGGRNVKLYGQIATQVMNDKKDVKLLWAKEWKK